MKPRIKDGAFSAEQGLTGEGADRVSRIIRLTVTEVLFETKGKRVSLFELEKLVGKIAAGMGASGELLAALVRNLSKLCVEARGANLQTTNALVSRVIPQYMIWTNGEREIVKDIGVYEKKKKKYLIWLDCDERVHRSVRKKGVKLGDEAIRLLIYLIERLGRRTQVTQVLRDIFDDTTADPGLTEKNKIDQQLTSIENFCGKGFRDYIFGEWFKKGLGLHETFSDEYFIFYRLR